MGSAGARPGRGGDTDDTSDVIPGRDRADNIGIVAVAVGVARPTHIFQQLLMVLRTTTRAGKCSPRPMWL